MCAALFVLLVFAAAAAAQSPSARNANSAFMVAVTDENGVAVPSARVFLQMPNSPPLHCETDFSGRCQLASPPAGTYQLRVEKEGFYALAQSSVEVTQNGGIDVSISHQQEAREIVNVIESPPAIDPAQVSSQQTLSGLDVLNIPYPATHDYRGVLNFIPGVVQDAYGQPHVAGSETYQTVTLLDTFNISQPANGQLLARLSTDSFRSIQVEPAREPAEFGKGSGGILSLNTGIGDDHFRFIAANFVPSFRNKNGWRFNQFLPRFTFSGPLRQGKMWFYDAIDAEYDNTVYTELPRGQDNDHFLRIGNLAKVQTNVTSRNILIASFLLNHLHDNYTYLSPQSPQLANPADTETAYIASLKDQHYFAGGQLLETGFAFDQYDLELTPYGTSPYFVTPETTGGNYYLGEQTRARRWQILTNLYLPPHQWHGHHDFKLGLDLDRLSYDAQFARQPISFLLPTTSLPTPPDTCLTILPSACSRYSTFSGGAISNTFNFETSAYAEDRWLLTDRLLIEPGIRFDWDQFDRNPRISPRLAGTYVLDNSGNTKLSAGIGLIYDPTVLFLVARPFAGQRTDYFFNAAGQPTDANGNPTLAPVPVPTMFSVNRSTLQAPRFLNWSLGLEKKLPAAIYLKAEFLEKRGTRGFVYNTLNAAATGTFVLENTRDDRYDALTLTLRHNFRESYMLMGSYTRSRSHSNQVLDFNVDSPILSSQQPGPYPWDTPNRFLSWGYIPFFKLPLLRQTEIAYSLETRTGFPFNANNNQQQLVGPPDSHRFPDYFSLNLQLEKRFHLFGYYFAIRGGCDNITDHSNPLVVNTNLDSTTPLAFSAFQGRTFTSRIRLLGRK